MKAKFRLGDEVYLTTDPDQFKRVVCQIRYDFNGILYVVSLGPETTVHFAEEMSRERTVQL